MSGDITYGVRLEGNSKSLVTETRNARDEFAALQKQAEAVNASSTKMASSYSGLNASFKQHNTEVKETASNVNKLLDRYDPLGAKLRQLQDDFKKLNEAAASGKIGAADDARVDQVYANLQKQIAGFSDSSKKATLSAGQLRMATQQLPLQFQDIWVSIAAGQNPMMVLAQQGSQISGSFGGVGNAAKAMGGYIMGLINPITLTASAVAAGAAAWYYWGDSAKEAAAKAASGLDLVRKKADDANKLNAQQQLQQVIYQIQSAELSARWEAGIAANTQKSNEIRAIAAKTAGEYRRLAEGLKSQKVELEKQIADQNKQKVDPNTAAAINMENDLFRKQMEQLGVSAEQVKVYELAMRGATKAEIDRAQAAADGISAINSQIAAEKQQAKAIEETNRILANIDPLYKANAEWQKLNDLHARGLLTSEQMGQAYAKTMGDMGDKNKKTAQSMSDTWKTFADNTQRTMSDVLYNGMNGKFNDIEDLFKQMLYRMAANAAAANIADAMFGSGKDGDKGVIGTVIKAVFNPSANGNAFGDNGVYAFADGGAFTNGLYDKPTPFKFANGGGFSLGVMGEAGPEAVMPLSRSSDGKLGVRAQGGASNQIMINDYSTINVDARSDRAQAISEINHLVDQKQAKLVDTLKRQGAIA